MCQLKIHEEKCEERTVKCPYISCLSVVEPYSAKLTIYKESLKTSYECSIIPIEQYPSEEDFPNHEK